MLRFSSAVLVTLLAGTTSAAATGVTMTGVHANEAFCQTMARQVDLFGQYFKLNPLGSDTAKRAKYFADQKALNATLVKTAPASLAGEVARSIRESNAGIDAQASGNATSIKATAAVLRSPEHLAASRRMTDYCGVKI